MDLETGKDIMKLEQVNTRSRVKMA